MTAHRIFAGATIVALVSTYVTNDTLGQPDPVGAEASRRPTCEPTSPTVTLALEQALRDDLEAALVQRAFWLHELAISTALELRDRDAVAARLAAANRELGRLLGAVQGGGGARIDDAALRAHFEAEGADTVDAIDARLRGGDPSDDVARFGERLARARELADSLARGVYGRPTSDATGTPRSPLGDALMNQALWTRLLVVEAQTERVSNLETSPAIVERLFQNAADIGAALVSEVGPHDAAELVELLRKHVVSMVRLVQSTKDGDGGLRLAASRDLYDNAHDVAALLAREAGEGAEQDIDGALVDYLDLTVAEVGARAAGHWQADVAAFDRLERHVRRAAARLSLRP